VYWNWLSLQPWAPMIWEKTVADSWYSSFWGAMPANLRGVLL
jgi:hypothetical protein